MGDMPEVTAAADESDGGERSCQGIEEAFVGEKTGGLTLEFGGVEPGQFRAGAVP
jgi:hypothetical protein